MTPSVTHINKEQSYQNPCEILKESNMYQNNNSYEQQTIYKNEYSKVRLVFMELSVFRLFDSLT